MTVCVDHWPGRLSPALQIQTSLQTYPWQEWAPLGWLASILIGLGILHYVIFVQICDNQLAVFSCLYFAYCFGWAATSQRDTLLWEHLPALFADSVPSFSDLMIFQAFQTYFLPILSYWWQFWYQPLFPPQCGVQLLPSTWIPLHHPILACLLVEHSWSWLWYYVAAQAHARAHHTHLTTSATPWTLCNSLLCYCEWALYNFISVYQL